MTMDISDVRYLLGMHYEEASGGVVDKPPSRLLRGEATERQFYIMKIDLAQSTAMLERRRKSTYLRLAHTYLSTVDRIAQEFGADADQMEYAGDSVLAYFPVEKADAEDVIMAACYARAAVNCIQELDPTLKSLSLRSKIVLHFDTLMVAKIGPRAGAILNAIGHPIHKVAKIEKTLLPDEGWATTEFQSRVAAANRKFLSPSYQQEPPTAPPPQFSPMMAAGLGIKSTHSSHGYGATLPGLMSSTTTLPPPPSKNALRDLASNNAITSGLFSLAGLSIPRIATPSPSVIGFRLRWQLLCKVLNLPN
jgi:class 3 adenylate cyclase